jgi:hypothetical protein
MDPICSRRPLVPSIQGYSRAFKVSTAALPGNNISILRDASYVDAIVSSTVPARSIEMKKSSIYGFF